MTRPKGAHSLIRVVVARWSAFFGFWLLLAGPGLNESVAKGLTTDLAANLAVGLLAAVAATWVSLRLLPPTPGRLHLAALARLALHFFWQSIVAGVDVARRAFDPRLPLKPGDLTFPTRLPPGTERAAFGAITSLMPGTLPVGTDDHDRLLYHCLDLDQPVAAGLARDEALMMRVRRGGNDRDD
ncbi:sodium:proton antiporter [Thiocystis minor]|uniref:Na+/H+ antiporter subunit E n=1 Tax=Thiocystis minor TaxID=61597 RepID=UPI001914A8AC|nr:Na+/H+ antiporter subunit E [Thiocystis minor]MBK5962674.1 sodium:proton antiporter [Thiocystis minor]